MTQQFTFRPSNAVAPSFQAVLDDRLCNIVLTWNVAGQRYYINIYNTSGNLVVARSLVETGESLSLNNLSWANGIVTATLSQPQYWRRIGRIVEQTIFGCQPDAYNGNYRCLNLSPTKFSYPLVANPGQNIVAGLVDRRHDMLKPWFKTSTMFYRNGIFQVDP
jgi:hypothetical protein